METVNYTNMEVKPIRYRYPMSSEQFNDFYDMAYWNLVELLGFNREDGTTNPSGILMESYSDIDSIVEGFSGVQASGYTQPLTIDSGTVDDMYIDNNYMLGWASKIIYFYT